MDLSSAASGSPAGFAARVRSDWWAIAICISTVAPRTSAKTPASKAMAVVIGIPRSADPAERRSPIVPDVVKKLRAAEVEIVVERGATDGAHLDADTLGEVSWVDTTAEVLAAADVVWTIGAPPPATTRSNCS